MALDQNTLRTTEYFIETNNDNSLRPIYNGKCCIDNMFKDSLGFNTE